MPSEHCCAKKIIRKLSGVLRFKPWAAGNINVAIQPPVIISFIFHTNLFYEKAQGCFWGNVHSDECVSNRVELSGFETENWLGHQFQLKIPPSPWRRRRSSRTNGHERDQPFKRLIFNSIKVFRLVGGSKSNQYFYFPRQSCFQGNECSNKTLLCLFDSLMCCENRFKGLLVWADWSKSFK